MTTASDLAEDEAREAEFVRRVSRLFLSDEEGVTDQNDATETLDNLIRLARFALLSPDAGGDQPLPSVSEDQGSSRDHALTDSVALDGWQPIETAPRDGTEILIAIGSDYIGSAFYADDDSDPYPWKFFDRNGIKPLANGIRDDRMGPTHWMPLPAPPSSAKPAPDAVPGTNPKTTDKGGE